MREILFRGKRLDNGEWVEGGYVKLNGAPFIVVRDEDGTIVWYEVDPVTVGQYTELKDKSGKRIFEGDILLLDNIKGVVNYGTGCFCVEMPRPHCLCRNNPAIDIVLNEYPGLEVIGNIHDNPELMEEEA